MPKFKKVIYGDPVVNAHIAEITGQRYHDRPYAWISGNKKYSFVSGAIALPDLDKPGLLFTAAVEIKTNIINCLEEYESDDPFELIAKAKKIQDEYGEAMSGWWGEPEKLMPVVAEAGSLVRISQFIDCDMKDAFEIYVARIKVALSATYKKLFFNECVKLRNHLLAFVSDDKSNKIVNILGGLIHSIVMLRPWEQSFIRKELIPTRFEDQAVYDSDKAIKELEEQLY